MFEKSFSREYDRFFSRATIRRMRHILFIMGKYGFGQVVQKVQLPFRKPVCAECAASRHLSQWARLRLVMEEIGPTTIKIGQVLSLRPDLVPMELCEELKSFQEDLAPDSPEDVRATLAEAFPRVDEVFSAFDETPVAAASLSQVHQAVLVESNQPVAVKLRRRGIVDLIRADLAILKYLAELLHEHVDYLRGMRLPSIVDEVNKSLMRELDFGNEARSMTLFNRLFADDPHICAPRVIDRYTRADVLVMEYLPGVRLDQFTGPAEQRRKLAEAGLHSAVKQMLEHGFFHADPHLGNLKVINGDTLCYYDWGMVGRLTPDMRTALIDYIVALVENDPEKVARVAMEMSVKVPTELDYQQFIADVMFVLERIHAAPGSDVNLGRFLLDLTALCRSYDIFLRSDYILMARALISTEAAGRTLDPDFDSLGALKSIALQYLARRRSVLFSDKPIYRNVSRGVSALIDIPAKVDRILRLAENGELVIQLRQKDHASQMRNIRQTAYIVSIGLMTASLVIGSSLIYTSDLGPHAYGLPLIGLAGFILSGLFAGWVIYKMVRQ